MQFVSSITDILHGGRADQHPAQRYETSEEHSSSDPPERKAVEKKNPKISTSFPQK